MQTPRLRRHAAPLLALCLMLGACSGSADPAVSTDDITQAATPATESENAPTEDASEGLVTQDDSALGDPELVVCDSTLAMLELVGDASDADTTPEQLVDAVELMGQFAGDLETAGADREVVDAADTIHAVFADIVTDPDTTLDTQALEASGAVLGAELGRCGYTPEDLVSLLGEGGGTDGGAEAGTQTFCDPLLAFVTAGEAFAAAEIGSTEEQDAVAEMEVTAFAFGDAVGDSDPDAVTAVFTLFESASRFIESGETGDVQAEGELVDSLATECRDAGF